MLITKRGDFSSVETIRFPERLGITEVAKFDSGEACARPAKEIFI